MHLTFKIQYQNIFYYYRYIIHISESFFFLNPLKENKIKNKQKKNNIKTKENQESMTLSIDHIIPTFEHKMNKRFVYLSLYIILKNKTTVFTTQQRKRKINK